MASDYHTLDLTADLPFDSPAPGYAAIYALMDPRDGALRYIGKTVMPRTREVVHMQPSVLARADHRARWLTLLKNAGLKPGMRVLAWVPLEQWQDAERAFIAEARSRGCRLTNTSIGGRGPMIRQKHTPAALAKMSATLKGHRKSPEWRANIGAAHRGKPKDGAAYDKMVATHRTPEYRARIAEITRRGHAENPLGLRRRQAKRMNTLLRQWIAQGMLVQLSLPF